MEILPRAAFYMQFHYKNFFRAFHTVYMNLVMVGNLGLWSEIWDYGRKSGIMVGNVGYGQKSGLWSEMTIFRKEQCEFLLITSKCDTLEVWAG